jgi:hypothetical protein
MTNSKGWTEATTEIVDAQNDVNGSVRVMLVVEHKDAVYRAAATVRNQHACDAIILYATNKSGAFDCWSAQMPALELRDRIIKTLAEGA